MEKTTESDDALMMNLKDAGCDHQLIDCFMNFQDKQQYDRQMILLSQYHKQLLDHIHNHQKQLDCLDYLIYKLKKNAEDI